jgi:hypothetical protein
MENGVRVQMDEFNLVVIKESTEDIIGREAKSVLEEGREHHNLSHIGCRNVFPGGRTARSGRMWFATSLWISLSSMTDGWKRCGSETAIAGEKDHSNTKLELVWWQRLQEMAVEEGVIRVVTRSPFKAMAMRGT